MLTCLGGVQNALAPPKMYPYIEKNKAAMSLSINFKEKKKIKIH